MKESEKAGLKLNVQKTKIMTSGPIISWQIDVERMERVTDFIFLGSKITGDGDGSYEIKRCLVLGRKAMTNLDSLLWQQMQIIISREAWPHRDHDKSMTCKLISKPYLWVASDDELYNYFIIYHNRNIVHNKYNVLESSLNHPLHRTACGKNCLPWCQKCQGWLD